MNAEGRKVVNSDRSNFSTLLFPVKVTKKAAVLPYMLQNVYSNDSHNAILLTRNKIKLACFLWGWGGGLGVKIHAIVKR